MTAPKNRVRILYLDHARIMGGAEKSLLYLMQALDRRRFTPMLACPGPLAIQAQGIGVKVLPLDLGRLKASPVAPLVLVKGVWAIVRLIKREGINILHANVWRSAIYGALAARLAGVPLVWHVRDIHRERLTVGMVGSQADRIVAISRAVANALPSGLSSKVAVVYNGIDLTEFRPGLGDGKGLRQELGLPPTSLLVGNVGWFSPWKGLPLFLQAASQVSQGCSEARFLVVGGVADASYHHYWQEVQEFAGRTLGDRVLFAGPRPDMPRIMAALDILVHTARDEPLGRTIIEAMAAARPVVAAMGGGVAESVIHEETGLLVPQSDPQALAGAILRLLQDKALRVRLGGGGRWRAERLFDFRHNAQQIEEIYRSLAGGG